MKNNFDALRVACNYVGLEEGDIRNLDICREGKYVCLSFQSLWLAYELYVDCEEGTVPGLDIRPCPSDWDGSRQSYAIAA